MIERSPDKITALIFECNKCKSRTTIPISKIEIDSVPKTCPRGDNWNPNAVLSHSGTPFTALIDSIKKLRDPKLSVNTFTGFQIFFQFDEPNLEKPAAD